jgi:hypothetical protein
MSAASTVNPSNTVTALAERSDTGTYSYCHFWAFQGGCNTGAVDAYNWSHKVWFSISHDLPFDFAEIHYVVRDVNNGVVVGRGTYDFFSDDEVRSIGGLYSAYRLEMSCICAASGDIWSSQ